VRTSDRFLAEKEEAVLTCSKRGGASNQIHGMGGGGAALTAPTVQFQLDPRLLALQSPSITKHRETEKKKKDLSLCNLTPGVTKLTNF